MVSALRSAVADCEASSSKADAAERQGVADTESLDTLSELPDIDSTATNSEYPPNDGPPSNSATTKPPVEAPMSASHEIEQPDAQRPAIVRSNSGLLPGLGGTTMDHAAKDYLKLLLDKKLPSPAVSGRVRSVLLLGQKRSYHGWRFVSLRC
jgi:hypothetical protein